jgi:hypothetical protein
MGIARGLSVESAESVESVVLALANDSPAMFAEGC